MQNAQPARTQWTSILILVVTLAVIATAVYVIFQMPGTKMQYSSVSLFIMVTVSLRMVKPIARNKLSRYAIASVVTLLFVVIVQLI